MSDYYDIDFTAAYCHLTDCLEDVSDVLGCVEMLVQDPSTLETIDLHYTDVMEIIDASEYHFNLIKNYDQTTYVNIAEGDPNDILKDIQGQKGRVIHCLDILAQNRFLNIKHRQFVLDWITEKSIWMQHIEKYFI